MKKRLISLVLAVMTFAALFILPANAATYSVGTKTQTFTVETKTNYWIPGSSSITVSQQKGTISYSKTNIWGKVTGTATKKLYGSWSVVAVATDGTDKVSKTLSGSSVKLNLKGNKTYRVTVTYDNTIDIFNALKYRNMKWTSTPTWKVSGTWKVKSYY